MIRDVLMVVYAGGWLFAVIMTQWRTGTVPAELWMGLGIGEGALLAVFRTAAYSGQHRGRHGQDHQEDMDEHLLG